MHTKTDFINVFFLGSASKEQFSFLFISWIKSTSIYIQYTYIKYVSISCLS